MEICPLVFPAVIASCCNLLTFLKSTHNLLFGVPWELIFRDYDYGACPFRYTFCDNTSMLKRFYFPLYPFICRGNVYGLELTGGLSPVSMSILTNLVLPMSSLCLGKASPYSSHSSSNFCLISVVVSLSCSCTLHGPGTSAGEQIKVVSGGISGSVSCLWGTQLCGLARCSLIFSSPATSICMCLWLVLLQK